MVGEQVGLKFLLPFRCLKMCIWQEIIFKPLCNCVFSVSENILQIALILVKIRVTT